MKLERVAIPGPGVTLAGLVYTPREIGGRCVVLSHGFTASKESMDLLAAYLCARGHTCVTFDARGHKLGGSSGELNQADEVVEDLRAVVGWTLGHLHRESCVLAGHSMGALASLIVGADTPPVEAVAAIATGLTPTTGFRQPVGLAMLSQRSDYVAGATAQAILEGFDRLGAGWSWPPEKPALFVAAKGDAVVKPARIEELARRAGPRAEYAEVEGTHLEAPTRAKGPLAAWLERLRG